jgi:type 2 lantibiotic biosynthesis protein LanM
MPINHSLLLRACTFDEVLSSQFNSLVGEKSQANLASERLASWCKSSASGDWRFFAKRLEKDQLEFKDVLARFSNVKLNLAEPDLLPWMYDAQWVFELLTRDAKESINVDLNPKKLVAFQGIFLSLLQGANVELKKIASPKALECFTSDAMSDFNFTLLHQLSDLLAPLLYSLFVKDLKELSLDGKLLPSDADIKTNHYTDFIHRLQEGGLEQIFNEKPVLLRLLAAIARQWIDTTGELVNRLGNDLEVIECKLLHSKSPIKVSAIEGDLSDPHNLGHSVRIIGFDDGSKIVYKPKDLGLDIAWIDFINHLNGLNPPVQLRVVNTIACDGYGWCEFIQHESCQSQDEIRLFYERSGAWLIIFHLLASSDMHYENIIASGSHPVPIDLETILQASLPELELKNPAYGATNLAIDKIQNSVLTVGMLPAYTKSHKNKIFDLGGLNVRSGTAVATDWKNINTNGMRWVQYQVNIDTNTNAPHIDSNYAKFGDYKSEFIKGFEKYAHFLLAQKDSVYLQKLWKSFSDLPVRKVLRPTRFYYALLQRLKDHRSMDDGIKWSVQADFLARLGDWDEQTDLLWPLHKSERDALLNFNVPFFLSPSNGHILFDAFGHSIVTPAIPGLQRAQKRWETLSKNEIDWQSLIIQISTSFVSSSIEREPKRNRHRHDRLLQSGSINEINDEDLIKELKLIIDQIEDSAFQDEMSVSWLGLDWMQNSEVAQLVPLGEDLYSGMSGIALFLAAYQHQFHDERSTILLKKIVNGLHEQIHASTSARWARSLGIGGTAGIGSIIYVLVNIATLLDDDEILGDAIAVSKLYTKELIDADQGLDVISGSAGAILCLLALYRQTQSPDVLEKAVLCGEHLLNSPRVGEVGSRTWIGLGLGNSPLNGMSHGAAGYAYALSSLHQVTQREDFADAARECLAYEQSQYDESEHNWPDLRKDTDDKPFKMMVCQWCHGAPGIGLARIGQVKAGASLNLLKADIENASICAERNWPNSMDTLCCGTLGGIEFLREAGDILNDEKIQKLASNRLKEIIATRYENGKYAIGVGGNQFNLGFFRGLSGVGYALLRGLNPSLPNVLIWE